MRDLLVTAIVFGSLPFILARPYIGIIVWSWLGYMNPHRLSWGFAYDFPFAQIVAITLIIAIAFSRESKTIPVNGLTVTWLLFIIWMGITTLFAIFPQDAQDYYARVTKIQLVVFFTLMLMQDQKRLNLLIWTIVISLGFFGVKGGIFAALTGGGFRVWGPPESYVEDNNSLAVTLLMILPLINYLRLQAKKKWHRHAFVIAMLFCGLAAAASHSRGAFLSGFAIAAFLWLKSKNKAIGGVTLLLLFPLLFAFMPENWHERMATIANYEQDASSMGRINAWHYSVNVANNRLTGAGFESWYPETFSLYAPIPEDVHAAHSIYFSVLADHGWIGLIMFVSILIMAWRNGAWIIRHTPDDKDLVWLRDLSRMIQVSFVAYGTGGAFLSLSYFDLPWHLIAVMVLARSILEKDLDQREELEKTAGVSKAPRLSFRAK